MSHVLALVVTDKNGYTALEIRLKKTIANLQGTPGFFLVRKEWWGDDSTWLGEVSEDVFLGRTADDNNILFVNSDGQAVMLPEELPLISQCVDFYRKYNGKKLGEIYPKGIQLIPQSA